MKIFSISKNDWAGCGYQLSEAINACTDHHSIAARFEESVLHFPYELMGLTGQRVRRLINWADVVHIHDTGFNLPQRIGKPVVITHHGTRFRRTPKPYIKQAQMYGWLITVATPDLTILGPPLLPDCRPDLSEYRKPNDEFTVAHSPTKRDVKGTEQVIRACKQLRVKLDLIENMSWMKCIKRKGRAHLVIDQFKLGYGCNAIEAWSMGIPVISNGSDDVIAAISKQFGYIPFVVPDSTLEHTIARLRDDREAWADAASVGHQHYLNHHSPEAVSKLAVWAYEQVIERYVGIEDKYRTAKMANKLPPDGQIRAEQLILVKYLGFNDGETEWKPDNGIGVTYKFSAINPLRYVYESDVPWFLDLRARKGNKSLFEKVH